MNPDQPHQSLKQRARQRGGVLLLTLLVTLAMISMGLLALTSTQYETASAGSLLRIAHAEQLADIALHHATTLMQQQGTMILNTRTADQRMKLLSDGSIQFINYTPATNTENIGNTLNFPAFPMLSESTPLLGDLGGVAPRYEVRIAVLSEGTPPAGQEIAINDIGAPPLRYCMIQFTATASIAHPDLPPLPLDELNDEQRKQALDSRVEYQLSAALTLGPFLIPSCAL